LLVDVFFFGFAHPANMRPDPVSFQPTRGTISER
jgi:hypothetical protein